MILDYTNTCPLIDGDVSRIKSEIKDKLHDIIAEVSPMFDGEKLDAYINQATEELYDNFSEEIESVRNTNVDMREAANAQLTDLELDWDLQINQKQDDLDAAEQDVDRLTSELSEKEDELEAEVVKSTDLYAENYRLNQEIQDLNYQISNLRNQLP